MLNRKELDQHIKNVLDYPRMYCRGINSFIDVIYHLNCTRGTDESFKKKENKYLVNLPEDYDALFNKLQELYLCIEEEIKAEENINDEGSSS